MNQISSYTLVMLCISHLIYTEDTGPTDPPSTTCSDLTPPTSGMIGYNMGTVSLRPVNTVATYTCNTGYTLNGGNTRTCGSDGAWSGSAPTCQGKEYKLVC